MIIIALIMSLIVAVFAGIVVFKYMNKPEEKVSKPAIKEVSAEAERTLLIEGLREINKKLREQIYETETINALLIQKSELEKKLDKITSIPDQTVFKESPIQPKTSINMPIQQR